MDDPAIATPYQQHRCIHRFGHLVPSAQLLFRDEQSTNVDRTKYVNRSATEYYCMAGVFRSLHREECRQLLERIRFAFNLSEFIALFHLLPD